MSRNKNISNKKRTPGRESAGLKNPARKFSRKELDDLDFEDLDLEDETEEIFEETINIEPQATTDKPEDSHHRKADAVDINDLDLTAKDSDSDFEENEALTTDSCHLENDDDLDFITDDEESETEEDEADEDIADEDTADALSQSAAGRGAKNVLSKRNLRLNLHLILVAAIFLIAVTAIYRLYRWNKGTPIDETDTEEVDPSQFDVETLDMIIPMDASLLEGREDDGETIILCLGNNPFSDDRTETGLASQIAQKTNATVYDCSFPDSSAACRYPTYNPEFTRDHFNLYYVIESFRNQEFLPITTIASQQLNPKFLESAELMQTIDMDKVDILIIMYDSTDYNIGTPSDNPDNPYDVTAFTGGLRTSIQNIKDTWPHIRIFVMSHTYAQHLDDDGNLHNGTITDLGNGTLNHYLVKESEAVMDCGVSFVDNYYGTINEDNYQDYLIDYMHYNNEGREKLADRIADIINNQMATVNSTTPKD